MTELAGTRVGAGRVGAIYGRVPESKEHDRTPVEEQVAACQALARALGYAVTAEATLSDTGPNATLARPGLTALLGLLATGAVAAVIVHTLDRLARPQSRALEALLTELRRRAVPLYVARAPKGYWYDPATGTLLSDAQAVAAASREEWRPPEYIIVPREYDEAR